MNNNFPDNPEIEVLKANKSGLFTNYIFKAIPLAFDESMSYYETLCALLHYLKFTIIPTVNNNAEAVAELQALYVELHDYVEHYFDNLDVQDEINNKLDELVESGELQEIISEYLNSKAVFGFDNVESMKQSTNLISGSYAETLGYYTKNDGGNALYKIRNINNQDDVDNMFIIAMNNTSLVAELIVNNNELKLKQVGVHADTTTDDTLIINNAIKYLAKNGGGTLIGVDGATSLINNNLWLIDNITYQFNNYTLKGNGTNTLFFSGYYDTSDDTLKLNYDPNVQYSGSNFPEHRLNNMKLLNARLSNCKIGIKSLCLNQRSVIEGCKFDSNITDFSIDISFSWGFKLLNNTISRTAKLTQFCDWTLIESNSFEGSNGEEQKLLIIGNGSYSCKIQSNGFHHTHIGIELKGELRNTEISNNHFESFDIGIYQGTNDLSVINNIYIHNNWFWAYANDIIGIKMYSLRSSLIEMNTFREQNFNFKYYIDIQGTNVYGNRITTHNNTLESEKNAKYNINDGTIIEYISGSNTNTSHPQREYFTQNYTAEKYVAKYNNRKNNIPLCTLAYTNEGHILNVRTFIDYNENYGVMQPVLFSIYNTPSSGLKTHLCGIVMGKTVTFFTNQQVNDNYEIQTSSITAEVAGYNGKLVILFNAHSGYLTEPTGIVKAL